MPLILLIFYLVRLLIMRFLMSASFMRNLAMKIYASLAVHASRISDPTMLENFLFDLSNVLSLVIVQCIKGFNALTSPLVKYTSLVMSCLMKLFFLLPNFILMQAPNFAKKLFFFLTLVAILGMIIVLPPILLMLLILVLMMMHRYNQKKFQRRFLLQVPALALLFPSGSSESHKIWTSIPGQILAALLATIPERICLALRP